MTLTSTKPLAIACALAVAAASHQSADAGLIIELSDGGTTVTVADGGVGDLSATPGVVVFSGSVGVFDVNVTTGLGSPLLGSPSSPVLDLNSVNVSSGGVGTLTVALTQTDNTGPLPGGLATLDVGGTTNGSIAVDSFVDASNAAFGTATPTAALGVFGAGPFSGSDASAPALASPYSATIVATVVHDDREDVTSFDAEYRIVPEPSSLALIAIGGALIARRRRG